VGRQRRRLKLAPLFALAAAWVAPFAGAQPAAWRVAGDNGGEVTLLGSMHVLRERDYPLPPLVDKLFDGADVLVMELDLDDIEPAEEQSTILGAATLKPGTVLRDVLDADVENFEPWFIAITIQELGMRQLGFDGQHGLEQYLVRKSRQAGKQIEGLETLAYQIGIFDALPPRSQQAMLAQTLQELDEAEETATRMADAWRAGDLGRLTDDLLEDFADFPGLYETLVTDRNAEWQKAIDELLREGRRYLVVVGALHLVGRDNLIDMLRARGHEVERLR